MESTRSRRWLVLASVAGLAVVGLSFVDGWLVHVRHLGGHGLTHLDTLLSAWELRSLPILAGGVVLAGVTVALGLSRLATPAEPGSRRALVSAGAALGSLALLAASTWPISHEGHASGVEISAGWPLVAGIALTAVMAGATVLAASPSARVLAGATAVALLLVAGGVAGRIVGLDLAEGTGRHYADGTYTREAAGGQPTERLTISGGTFAVGDRWAGSLEGEGLVVALTDDPACPDVRGSYHVFGVTGTDDLRFEAIVDTCADGERDADLSTGIWRRGP